MKHNILFTGTTGAGKTTAISAVSEITALSTDVTNYDCTVKKNTTTVGLDYGEMTLANGDTLRLYGTPGQTRFDFMWEILSRGALGLIILIDNQSSDPLTDLDTYLNGFKRLIADTACVVVICRMDTHPNPTIDCFAQRLEKHGVICPVLAADVRDPIQVAELLELLMMQLESKLDRANYEK
ncbi:GTP-binding protein [Sapientia aquatica]|uniref:GTP-binding protein n=1 Tax=Sapientia aquatica TaxID=1549640 RepID=A0A4V3AUF0_9BURK|nr:GTP-binding protein [Sapientia aquatica]